MKTMRHLLMAGTVALVAPMVPTYAAPPDNTIVVGLSADASTFDPAQISSRDNSNIARHIFRTLYEPLPTGEIVPDVATAYSVSDDGLEYTYTIPTGLTCEDGEALTAEDVAYSFTRSADPALAFTGNTPGYIFTSIDFKGAEAISDTEAKITIGRKNPIAFTLMTEVMIHCKDSYEKMTVEEAAEHPVGSGAYKLVTWDRASQVVLEKYREPGTFDNLIYRIIPEASTRSAELIAGNVDIITNVAPDQLEAINSSGTAEVQSVQGTRRIYVGFNLREDFAAGSEGGAAIQKTDVRKAMQYAIDVPAICSQLLNFDCERATGLVNPPNGNPDLVPYAYDPDKAEAMLDEAGYPRGENGVRFTIKLQGPRGRYLNDANVVQAIGQYLTDVGIETEVDLMEFASVYVPLIRAHDAGPLFFLGTGGNLSEPLIDMTDLATVESGTNYTSWANPDWFDGWAEIAEAATPEAQRPIINRMLDVFYNDPPWLMLYFQPDFYGVSERITWEARRDERVYLWDAALAK
ncbi:peptide/nickel transport system substrate-binding protein [Devosia sp. YR412]|uniref:ABC transporter substrate-binding protein n=1 Tax=Devosia sp. YR412 TaxID=1881030 RepID=UPI0008BB0F7A|nr:ABC transporter substrate-binding protein [Devosia sp. YR412]SEQ40338.1 peptide/nickel transport system substrate-binding protein [Devosia sp. YR412]